ncbi:MAG: ABC transporter substrate-binding protein [Ignavibacteria bacterium]
MERYRRDGVLDKVINGKKTDFKFTFTNNNNPTRKKVMLIIIEQLKQLGIQADLQDYEWSVFLEKTKKHEYDACYGAWQLGVTPEDPYQIWHSSQSTGEGSNFISYKNPESDKLLEQNRVTFDENERVELLNRWQKLSMMISRLHSFGRHLQDMFTATDSEMPGGMLIRIHLCSMNGGLRLQIKDTEINSINI